MNNVICVSKWNEQSISIELGTSLFRDALGRRRVNRPLLHSGSRGVAISRGIASSSLEKWRTLEIGTNYLPNLTLNAFVGKLSCQTIRSN